MRNPPCEKDCPRRTAVPNCHGTCEDYAKYVEYREEERNARAKRNQEGGDVLHVRCDKINKIFFRSRNGLPKKR